MRFIIDFLYLHIYFIYLFIYFILFIYFFFTEGEKPETKQKRLESKYAPLQIVANIERLGTAKVRFLLPFFDAFQYLLSNNPSLFWDAELLVMVTFTHS